MTTTDVSVETFLVNLNTSFFLQVIASVLLVGPLCCCLRNCTDTFLSNSFHDSVCSFCCCYCTSCHDARPKKTPEQRHTVRLRSNFPFITDSGQQIFFHYNINTRSRKQVRRIKKSSTRRCLDVPINSQN